MPGDHIHSIDGASTPTMESVVSRFALATAGQPLQVDAGAGPRPIVPVSWPSVLLPSVVPAAGDWAPDAVGWVGAVPDGAHVIVWTGAECPSCEAALERARRWVSGTGQTLVHIDDVASSGLNGARADLGGWTADAFAIDRIPSMVAVDAAGRIAWRVDGWSPPEGIDLPELVPIATDPHRFPHGPTPAAGPARGTPAP